MYIDIKDNYDNNYVYKYQFRKKYIYLKWKCITIFAIIIPFYNYLETNLQAEQKKKLQLNY